MRRSTRAVSGDDARRSSTPLTVAPRARPRTVDGGGGWSCGGMAACRGRCQRAGRDGYASWTCTGPFSGSRARRRPSRSSIRSGATRSITAAERDPLADQVQRDDSTSSTQFRVDGRAQRRPRRARAQRRSGWRPRRRASCARAGRAPRAPRPPRSRRATPEQLRARGGAHDQHRCDASSDDLRHPPGRAIEQVRQVGGQRHERPVEQEPDGRVVRVRARPRSSPPSVRRPS